MTMQNIHKAVVTWSESWGLAPGGGLAYKAWFKTLKTQEEGWVIVFSEAALRVEDFIFVERQGEDWREVVDFDEKYLLRVVCE